MSFITSLGDWLRKITKSFASASISGQSITLTRHNGDTVVLTTQDTVNNAFTKIKIGTVTLEPDSTADTLTIGVGAGISLSANATNDSITIGAVEATQSIPGIMSTADKTKLDGIATGAEVNQNAFAIVKVGATNITADAKQDTLNLSAGTGITLNPNATTDTIEIKVSDNTYAPATHSHSDYVAKSGDTMTGELVVPRFYSVAEGNVQTKLSGTGIAVKMASSSTDGTPNNGVVLEVNCNLVNWGGQLFIGDNDTQRPAVNGWSNGAYGQWKQLAFLSDIPSIPDVATTSVNGLMSATDKTFIEALKTVSSADCTINTSLFGLYSNVSANKPVVYKNNKICMLTGVLTPLNNVATGEHTLCTIPDGYRPIRGVSALCQGSGANKWMLNVKLNGDVTIQRYGVSTWGGDTIPSGAWLPFSITYICA